MFITGAKWTLTGPDLLFPLGQRGTGRDGIMYKYVQYNSAAGVIAAVAGDVAFYYAPSGVSAGSGEIVTCDVSDSAGLGAGVLMSAIATGEYGWVQTHGKATVTTALTSGGDGQPLVPGAADRTLKLCAAVTDSVCAHAIDASAKIIMCEFSA